MTILSELQRIRTPAGNSTYPKGGVSCTKARFVVNETFVLLINICGESPALRVAAKRYRLFYDNRAKSNDSAKNKQIKYNGTI